MPLNETFLIRQAHLRLIDADKGLDGRPGNSGGEMCRIQRGLSGVSFFLSPFSEGKKQCCFGQNYGKSGASEPPGADDREAKHES